MYIFFPLRVYLPVRVKFYRRRTEFGSTIKKRTHEREKVYLDGRYAAFSFAGLYLRMKQKKRVQPN